MDLRLLRTFRTIADAGSISAATRVLHVTQPALTRQVQQLERQLGLDLFVRQAGRLSLTSAGARFLDAARDVLASAETAGALARALAAGRLTHVRAAAPNTTLTDVLAPFLAALEPDDPLITVEEEHYVQAVDGLRSRLDFAVLTAPPPAHLRSHRIAELPVWAYGAFLGERLDLSVAELAEHRLLVLGASARSRRLIDEALAAEDVAAVEVLECSNPQVAQALAAAGRGVAVVSDDPRFGLCPVRVRTRHGHLVLALHAAWAPAHHAADELERLARRLEAFCAERYPAA